MLTITVLNRARPENEERERKTASGRTFKVQGWTLIGTMVLFVVTCVDSFCIYLGEESRFTSSSFFLVDPRVQARCPMS